MKICLSQIPEKDRQAYIREEAIHRVYNKLNNKFRELRSIRDGKTN